MSRRRSDYPSYRLHKQKVKLEGRCKACKAAAALPAWHSHQLRHTMATKICRKYGLDVARVVLGHRSPQIMELYAELDAGGGDED